MGMVRALLLVLALLPLTQEGEVVVVVGEQLENVVMMGQVDKGEQVVGKEVGKVEQVVNSSTTDLEGIVDELVERMDAQEAAEEVLEEVEEVEEPPSWLVGWQEEGEGFCLLVSGQLTLELYSAGESNRSRTVSVPWEAQAEGSCQGDMAEMRLVWTEEGGEESLLNLVIRRSTDIPNLVYLSGAFLRVGGRGGVEEFHTEMEMLEYSTLLWPIRYQVRCARTLTYDMQPIKEREGGRRAVLQITGLRVEAFRDVTLHDHRPLAVGPQWYRREWGCEFHRVLDWAPYLVAFGLAAVILFFVIAFLIRNSRERRKLSKYETL